MHNAPTNPVRRVLYALVYKTGTLTIRVMLAIAATICAILFLFSGLETFANFRLYSVMRIVPPWAWFFAFSIYSTCIWWRIWDVVRAPVKRCHVAWDWFTNILGFLLWGSFVAMTNLGLGQFTPLNAAEITLCLASWWVVFRTDNGPEWSGYGL